MCAPSESGLMFRNRWTTAAMNFCEKYRVQGVRIRASHKWQMTVLQIAHGTGKTRIPKQRSEPGIVEATIPASYLVHGNVKVCCVASDEALVLLLSGTAAYLPDLSAADHLITPCWLGMVQMVSTVVEAGDVSQLRFIQGPHDVRVPQLEL